MENRSLFLSSFALLFVAELPGKSTLASALMASRAKTMPVFLGACGAYVVHSALAVGAGKLIGLLPPRPVQLAVAALFLVLAALLWNHHEEVEDGLAHPPEDFQKTLGTAFGVVFVSQWGDPTQIATAALAAQHPLAPGTVFIAATLALSTVTGGAVLIGHCARKVVRPRMLHKAAALVFAAIGLALFLETLR